MKQNPKIMIDLMPTEDKKSEKKPVSRNQAVSQVEKRLSSVKFRPSSTAAMTKLSNKNILRSPK
jgi:hypothetical protein